MAILAGVALCLLVLVRGWGSVAGHDQPTTKTICFVSKFRGLAVQQNPNGRIGSGVCGCRGADIRPGL